MTTPEPVAVTKTFTVATYNVRHRRSDHEIRADIDKLIGAGATVICLQEMGGHSAAMRNLPTGWSAWTPRSSRGGAGRHADPVQRLHARAYSPRVPHRLRRRHRSRWQPGGDTVPEKTITWVRFRVPRTTFSFVVLNTHAVPSVEAAGHPDEDHPRRLALFADLMDGHRHHGETAAAGRLPGHRVRRPQRRLPGRLTQRRPADSRSPRSPRWACAPPTTGSLPPEPEGTLDNRLIDYVAHTPGYGLEPRGQSIGAGYGSDHRPLLVSYALTEGAA